MTLQQLQEETGKEFDERFDLFATEWTVPPTLTVEVLKHIKSFIKERESKAYEAGRREALERVCKKFINLIEGCDDRDEIYVVSIRKIIDEELKDNK